MSESTDLRERLIGEGLDPGAWSNGPGDRYPAHDHEYDKVILPMPDSAAMVSTPMAR